MSLEVDGEPAEECPVCETVWCVKYDRDDPEVWRFKAHPAVLAQRPEEVDHRLDGRQNERHQVVPSAGSRV